MAAPHVRSFDVFDTVLTRTVGAPEAVHLLLGRRARDRGLIAVEPVVLASARDAAERRLVRLLGRQPRLREIHEELVLTLGLVPALAAGLEQLELEVEREVIRTVPGADALVQQARASGAAVVFVSDSPYPGSFVTELLDGAGLHEPGEAVYSSADVLLTKSGRGELFDHVARDLGVPPERIHHVGDNVRSDVAGARARGWRASPAPAARLNRYETMLHRAERASDGVSARLAGASRQARMRAVLDGVHPDRAAVAAGVMAPLLVAYGLWLLREAEQRGLRRLYFLSRDGEVILDVVRQLAEVLGSEVECRYLYGSRAAWRPASLHFSGADDLSDVLHGDPSSPPRTVLHRVGMTPEDALALVDHPLLRSPRADEPLDAAGLADLQQLLQGEPLLPEVRRRAGEAAALVVDYLRQEGLGDDPSVGLVDVGWLGRTSRGLLDVMDGAGLAAPEAFFFIGVRAGSSRWSSPRLAERQVAYLFDHTAGHGVPGDSSGQIALVETFCAGREGSTLGYRREGNALLPVLVRPDNEAALRWGLEEVRGTVREAVDELLSGDLDDLRRIGDLRGVVDALLREFWERPTPGEVEVWGSFPFEADDAHRTSIPLAAPVDWRSVAGELRLGRVRLRPVSSWRAGTASVSGPPWRQVLRLMAARERHQPRLARLPYRVRTEVALRRR